MGFSRKQYRCPTCEKNQTIVTDHFRYLTQTCSYCGGPILMCVEPQSEDLSPDRHFVDIHIIHYAFNLTKPKDGTAYSRLVGKLESRGYQKAVTAVSAIYMRALTHHQSAKLYIDEVHETSWISSVGKLSNWFEAAFPVRHIKTGYYLEPLRSTETLGHPPVHCSEPPTTEQTSLA